MLTLKDVDLLKKTFLTKEDFVEAKKELMTKKEFMAVSKDFQTKQDGEDLRHELHNDLLDFKDAIITEIRALRQETTINSSFRSKIDNHEVRIKHLESSALN